MKNLDHTRKIVNPMADIDTVSEPIEEKVESRAFAKGLLLLEELSKEGTGISLSELAERIALGKASTLRLLQTLIGFGLVAQDESRLYTLCRPWPYGSNSAASSHLVELARPEMQALNADLSETVSLAVLVEDHVRVVEVIESTHNVRLSNYRNRILPPYASSLGKAITAFQTPEKFQLLLQVFGIYQITPQTVTDPALIRQEMARVRERGYANEYEETVAGGCCFGAPIFWEGEAPWASLSVALPTIRLTKELEEILPKRLMAACGRISKRMASKRP